jgi:hypothetical protein
MQPTTPAFDAEKARDPNAPVLELDLNLTGETLYLTNRGHTLTSLGQEYAERLLGGVTLELSGEFRPQSMGRPPIGVAEILIANADDVTGTPWSDLLATRTLTNRPASLFLNFLDSYGNPLPYWDRLMLLYGQLALPDGTVFTDEEFRLELRDGSDAWHKEVGTLITAAAFPEAPPDFIGQMLPIVYGAVEKHRCLPIGTGARTTLSADIDEAATTIPLTDAAPFPASGSIWLDEEEIAYAAKSGNSLTGATRAAEAIKHDRGGTVLEKKSVYTWTAAEHACKSVGAVYVRRRGGGAEDWIRLDPSDYTIDTDAVIIPD